MHARPVPVPRGLPDALDGRRVDVGVVFVGDSGDRVQIGGHPDPAVGAHAGALCSVAER